MKVFLSTGSPRYIAITNAVNRMIMTDFQLFSIIEDEGFKLVFISQLPIILCICPGADAPNVFVYLWC